jgi:hypothetical protein
MANTNWFNPRVAHNLDRAWVEATPEQREDGMGWYARAHAACVVMGEKYNLPVTAVCGVIAALSPGRGWEINLRDAQEFLHAFSKGARGKDLPAVGTYGGANLRKAERCARGEEPLLVLGGLKVRAFYTCLANPPDPVTVCLDRHMKYAARGERLSDRESAITPVEYRTLVKHFQRGARNAKVLPSQYQAVLWVVWRDRREDQYKALDAAGEPRFFQEANV